MRNSPLDTVFQTECRLCPRRCGVDRRSSTGFCRAGSRTRVYRFGLHHGEEPPVSGERGSGTVFFSRCTMRCVYCQNYPWSQMGQGRDLESAELATILEDLARQGCHNWNLVSPTPWLPDIVRALDGLRERGLRLPVVFNTSGFEAVETMEALGDRVDVYLSDLRYADPATAAEASMTPQYVTVAREALLYMWRSRGPLQCDAGGVAMRGVICRILVLPGRANEAVESLRWLALNIGPEISVSLMAQYTPAWQAVDRPGWNRSLTESEYRTVVDALETFGFANGWVQDLETPAPSQLLGYNMPGFEAAAV